MRALTLIRPWDQSILRLGKDIENRKWKPFRSVIGKVIALHAGSTYDADAELSIVRIAALAGIETVALERRGPSGAIVGTIRVTGVVDKHDSRWFFGPFGWTITEARTLPRPIPIAGMLGLWKVPQAVEADIMHQLPDLKEVSL